jgi:DNA-directed RNA polymerase I subunit RPA43
LQSPDHIGLLIYGTFNASIPREHISQAHYEWRASSQEEQPEEETDEQEESDQPYEYKKNEFGEWIDKASGQGVADNNGVIEFNVVKYVL